MSETYTEFVNTNFPDNIDNWERKSDPDTATSALITKYKNGETLTATEQASIKKCMYSAIAHNQLRDAILAVETYSMSDVRTAIANLATDSGEWSSSATYKPLNFVNTSDGVLYVCIKENTNISPTNDNGTYWKSVYATGSVGTRWKGEYSASTSYSKPDMVYYNNAIYVATQTTSFTGQTPSDNSSYWEEVLSLTADMISVGADTSLADHVASTTLHPTTAKQANWDVAYSRSVVINSGTSAPTASTNGDIYFQFTS